MAAALAPHDAEKAKLLFIFGMDAIEVAEVLGVPADAVTDDCRPTIAEAEAYAGRVKERKRRRNSAQCARLAASPSRRIRNSVSARLWAALKGRTDGAIFSRLGYTAEELVSHLERLFRPGMTWANYGQWHVDHIVPCAAFDQAVPEQFAACWALSNLQPLWSEDNLKKGASRD